jgi:hypothetical protein
MCVIYLFGGIGKARGTVWWDGTALWLAFATLEYQSLDMVWTVHYPWLLATMAHVTLFWEISYTFLIWPKLTRPIMLILAVFVHAGIGIAMGMKTFGLIMIIANLAFVSPEYVAATAAALGRLFMRKAAPSDAPAKHEREPARRPLLAARVAHSSTAGSQ